eukprot:Phypoly_transcript_12288.p1 GENE.Phypoly_transcript_12288~~Phypoly_transcript_12288.p1  ORF type:complete len:324 (+),score=83.81 Phypoly_transcript_12288:117-974(+)
MSSTDNIASEAESRGIKRGASLVFDAQETAQNVANKVANTAEGVYNTVAEAVVFAQTHTVAETVKTGANVALETAKEAVEVAKEKTAATVAAMQETYNESAEIVKKNASIALDKTGHVMEDAACAVLKAVDTAKETGAKAVDNMKETTAYISSEAKKHTAETAEIVSKNVNLAKETVMSTTNAALQKGQESASYAKGVTEGVVGAAKGGAAKEETDLHIVSNPTPTGESAVKEAPHVSDSTSETQLQEAGINVAKAEELSKHIPDKSMASEAKISKSSIKKLINV